MQGEVAATEQVFSAQRRAMVDGQIRTFDVTDQRVLDVFYRTPREGSLPASLGPICYSDKQIVLPASEPGQGGRVLMQPMYLARLLQSASLEPTDAVLIVGGGSGYAAAIVAPLVASVVTLDSDPAWAAQATSYLASLGLGGSVSVVTGPLAAGHPASAPFNRIIVNGGVEQGLEPLFSQLAPGGCLLAIESRGGAGGSRWAGKATRFDNVDGTISSRAVFDAHVPVLEAFRTPDSFVF